MGHHALAELPGQNPGEKTGSEGAGREGLQRGSKCYFFQTGSYLAPEELPHSNKNTPEPLAEGEPGAAEGLPTKLHDDDLEHRRERVTPRAAQHSQGQRHLLEPHVFSSLPGITRGAGPHIWARNCPGHQRCAGCPAQASPHILYTPVFRFCITEKLLETNKDTGQSCGQCLQWIQVLPAARSPPSPTSLSPHPYLSCKRPQHHRAEDRVAVNGLEDVPLPVDLARIDLVEQLHHDEGVEDDGVVLGGRGVERSISAAVDVKKLLP